MGILVVGSVALDTVTTPSGTRREMLGGSATHFSASASFFTGVRLVAVVGEDFGPEHEKPLRDRGVDLGGLQRVPGRTFRWTGEYGDDLNNPTTLETQLNVFAGFEPVLPPGWNQTQVLFLANIDPELQWKVLEQTQACELVAADTMNYWIGSKPEALRRLLPRVKVLLINDGEIRQLTGRKNVVEAADAVRDLGTAVVVVKRGEHGVAVFGAGETFAIPAFPLRKVVDPTGAGDTFAGGFLGFLARSASFESEEFRRAAVAGSVMASFQVEDFSLDRLKRLTPGEIRERYDAFRRLTAFGAYPDTL
jgi:sugar/nucleoside kinase (ribokinase family)